MLRSFRFQLTLIIGLLALALAAALSWRLGTMLTDEALRTRAQALDGVANGTALLLADGLQERIREVELLATSREAQRIGLDPRAWKHEIARLQRGRPHYGWIGITDARGRVVAAAGGLLVGVDASQRPWFQKALQGPHVGDVHPAKLLQPLLAPDRPADDPLRFIDFVAPLRNAEGQVIGTLGTHADWRWAADVVAQVRRPDLRDVGTRVYVIDREGRVIHQPLDNADAVGLGTVLQVPRQPQLQRWPDGHRYLTVATAVRPNATVSDLGWTVVVRQPEAQALAGVVEAQRHVRQAGLLAVALTMLAAYGLAARFSRPLQDISNAARRIEAGELGTRLPLSRRSSELATLSQSLSGMVNRMLERELALAEAKSGLEARVAERTTELAEANARLDRLAHEDALTRLPNRRAADAMLARELALHQRERLPLAVLLADIDHFKRINDQHGHPVGDKVLAQVAARLSAALRSSDAAARFGGEEFLVLLPGTDADGLAVIAEKLRAAVADAPVDPVGRVTLSFGAARLLPGDNPAQLLQRADLALYEAKAGGRNRVCVARSEALAHG